MRVSSAITQNQRFTKQLQPSKLQQNLLHNNNNILAKRNFSSIKVSNVNDRVTPILREQKNRYHSYCVINNNNNSFNNRNLLSINTQLQQQQKIFNTNNFSITRSYSTHSHYSGILYSQVFLHSAFRAAIQQLHDLVVRLQKPLAENETRESQIREIQTLVTMLEGAVRGYDELEAFGWLPAFRDKHDVTRRTKQYRVRESQALRHMNRVLKRLRRHHAHLDSHQEDIDSLDSSVKKLRDLLVEHFDIEEKELLPLYSEAFSQSEIAQMFHEATSKLHVLPADSEEPADDSDVHRFAWEYNSIEMCEALIREVLNLPEDAAVRVLSILEGKAPHEVWQQLRYKYPQIATLLEKKDFISRDDLPPPHK